MILYSLGAFLTLEVRFASGTSSSSEERSVKSEISESDIFKGETRRLNQSDI